MKKISALALALALVLLASCAAPAREDFPPFPATILETGESSLLVLADEGADVRRSSDRFWVAAANAALLDEEGNAITLADLWWCDRVEVAFTGGINETYPAQIAASKITRLPKTPLTREAVMALAQRPEELDWADFAPYQSAEVGSGLYIQCFDIDEDYYLLVGGVPQEKPWYAQLCTRVTDGFVDILGEDFSIDQLFAERVDEEEEPDEMEGADETEELDVMDDMADVEEATASSGGGDYPAAIRVDGRIYHLYQPMPAEVDPNAILGETTSYTDGWPEKDGETNFSRELDLPYAQVKDGIAVLYENEWWFCYEVK